MKEMENKLTFRRIAIFIAGLLICSMGDSMNFKAAIGVTPYEATQLTGFYITGIQVGTLAIASNCLLMLLQVIMLRKITPSILVQIPLCLVQGYIFNFIINIFVGNVNLNYPMRVLFLLCGIILAGIGVGLMVFSDVTVFPLESFCKVLSERCSIDFAKCRQGADIVFVAGCLLVSFLFHYPFAIREGTIVATLLFSPIMDMTIKRLSQNWKQ